ncbi:BAH [Nesidiocoris tenuis]|uniref:BAH n=1 Tax=Nesidiocoris tenuis TaxID=355587 RepID=A0ABN7ARV2_9HEMI|nr:BAH [Nesidiocoris tenuis]
MSKRRRTSMAISKGLDDDDDSQSTDTSRRKKVKTDPSEFIQQLYDSVRNYKKEDGALLCEAFIRAPKRRQEPAYYEVVSNPIDLMKVQQKLRTDEYDDLDDFIADIELMVNNAKAFYKRTSQEYKDANELWELLQTNKAKLLDDSKAEEEEPKHTKPSKGVGRPKKSVPVATIKIEEDDDTEDDDASEESNDEDVLLMCEDLFTAVMQAKSEDDRLLYAPFQLIPLKKRYPKYYEVIDSPIDLKTIGTKIQQGKYTSLNEMEKDLLLMTKNACTFNEPGSKIYKDAKALRKFILATKTEIEQGKFSPGKGSDRIRTKKFRSGNSLSAAAAAWKYDEDEDDDDNEDMVDISEEPDNPCWQLFDTVKSYTSPQGDNLAEPFQKLPSKRFYPDYFKEIRNPISLAQIGKKLQKGDYGTVSEVAGDLNIMFENAKKYNRPDSKLYKDAAKLQKIMQKRVKELLDFDEEYSGSEDDSNDEPPKKIAKQSATPSQPQVPAPKLLTKGKYMDNLPLKKRLYVLCKTLMNYVCEGGRQPMLMFMEKPSRKLYPDYYEVIDRPMDMLTIESNIKAEKYQCEDEVLADFKLMFANCRKYNEVGSMIYDDAKRLEKVLMDKVKELGPLHDKPPADKDRDMQTPAGKKTPKGMAASLKPKKLVLSTPTSKSLDPSTSHKLRTLYHTVRDFKDPKGRQLSQIFLKLPSKVEYPDYYEVIKKPINLEQISQKLKSSSYDGLDDLCADLVLMFDNACKYNEPDSQIYKDALALQKVVMQTKLQLRQDEQSVPDVPSAVQELLMSLFISVYNHQDEEGRCFSDSMQEVPEHDEVNNKKVRALSLDLIKRRLDSGQYKRLDTFQEDVFACLQRARNLTRSDSQVFEDSVELQSHFIRQRDELCQNGDLLHSPALSYTLLELSNTVDVERQSKQATEQPEEDLDPKPAFKEEQESAAGTADNAFSFNQQVYRIGDFVYAENKERGMDPIILNIQRLWTNQEGQQMMYGNQYYRPNETYHVTTRKFLENEVFKTDMNIAVPLNQVLGRCCILSVKDYFKSKPDGVEEKDVFVCESRYSARQRSFKKIKNWPASFTTGYRLVPRDEVLEPKRVVSVFKQRVEKHKEEIAELEEQEKLVEKEKPNIPVTPASVNDDGWVFYEQLNTPVGLIKTGDCVKLKNDSGRDLIAQADTIWMNREGEAFFRGPWVMMPTEINYGANRTFYKQEVFVSTLEDTHMINNIVSKCVVLEHSEYISCRPTEYAENDVYICESIYDEVKRQVRPLPREGLKKYTHLAPVLQDEIYFFRRLFNPPKFPISTLYGQSQQPSCSTDGHQQMTSLTQVTPHPFNSQIENSVDSDMMMEDSLDGPPPSVGSVDVPQAVVSTPAAVTKKVRKDGKKSLVTGYILYSGDVRKSIAQNNPESNFGEVSKLVGIEWRKLTASEKAGWEEKAARINEETNANPPPSPVPALPTETIFECAWDTCDWQFEDLADAIEHAVADPGGHLNLFFQSLINAGQTDIEYQCQWRGCTRTKKTIPPFPNIQRLQRHVKEVHLMKNTGRAITMDQRSKHYVPSRKAAMMKAAANAAAQAPGAAVSGGVRNTPSPSTSQNGGPPVTKLPDPLFIAVPPRPQRLLHSDVYIKYIEGLTSENRNVSNWEKQMKATQTTTEVTDTSRLPAHWLGNKYSANKDKDKENLLTALWTLRDHMFRDAVGISKNL